MPQVSNVLCCHSCQMFQTSLVKKVKEWQCKICGEKQSIIKVYYEGSGKDCRGHVQMLNSMRQSKQQLESEVSTNMYSAMTESFIDGINKEMPETVNSKWSKYLNSSQHSEDTEIGTEERYDAQMGKKFHVDVSASKNKLFCPNNSSKPVKRNSTIDEFFSKKTVESCDKIVDNKYKSNSLINESLHISIKKRNSSDHDYSDDDKIGMNVCFKKGKMGSTIETAFSGDLEKYSANSNLQYKESLNTDTEMIRTGTAYKNFAEDEFRSINTSSKSLKSFNRRSPHDSNFTCVDENDSPKDLEDDFLFNDWSFSQTETEPDKKTHYASTSMLQSMKNDKEEVLESQESKIDENIDPNDQNSGSIDSDRSKLSFVRHKPELDSCCNFERNKKSIFENDDDLDDLLDV